MFIRSVCENSVYEILFRVYKNNVLEKMVGMHFVVSSLVTETNYKNWVFL